MILYIGIGLLATGLVITALVGLEDRGFTAVELKLIGPGLVVCGMFLAVLRILFFTLASWGRTHKETETLFKRKMFIKKEFLNDENNLKDLRHDNEWGKPATATDFDKQDENPLIRSSASYPQQFMCTS